MKLRILMPLLVLLPLFMQAGELEKGSCRYIIRFEPEVSQKSAEEILRHYNLKIVHIYETLSSASDTLILAAESSDCSDSLSKRVSEDPKIISARLESRKSPMASEEPQKEKEASSFSPYFGLFFYLAFLLISFTKLNRKEQVD